MISLLLPSRGRPFNVKRLADSVMATADDVHDIEIIVYLDDDDPADYAAETLPAIVKFFTTKRTLLSEYWNMAYEKAQGAILGHMGDDIVFQTKGWDTAVKEAFDKYPDKIVLVYGDDGDPNKDKNFGSHSFIHKNWVEAVGYFTPPYFSSDFNDTWLNEVADMISRKVKIDILTEHMHPAFHKGEIDLTHAERYVRHWQDKNIEKYNATLSRREADAEKLRKVMQ